MSIVWNDIDSVHLIGIGGIGISALARLLLDKGKIITGTEDNESVETLNDLRRQGVLVSSDLNPDNLPIKSCYIYSDAWLTRHPLIINKARMSGVPMMSYAEALGSITRTYKIIAVSGSHGKTTTTAMLTDIFEDAGLDPTSIIGSLRAKTKSNYRSGRGEYCIVEADEYRRHFLNLDPYILVITNLDLDHLDYFKNMSDIQSAFRDLAKKVPSNGYVICRPDDKDIQPVIKDITAQIIDYGTLIDTPLALRVLPFNIINAAAALCVAKTLNIDWISATKSIESFTGTWRRFEYKGVTKGGAVVYDDYAHHPKEVVTTLQSVRKQFPKQKIWVVFQPHLYSRTKALMEEFSHSFSSADHILLAPIYAAREEKDVTVSSLILAEKIQSRGLKVQLFDSYEKITEFLEAVPKKGDTIITMGAGDIYKVAETIIEKK